MDMLPAASVPGDPGAGPSIMVVDSDRRARSALKRLMEATHTNARVIEIADAATALSEAQSAPFDLILVDMRLPDLASSCELIRKIGHDQYVVALSLRQDDAPHARAAGARDFVWKTNSSDLILQAVRAPSVVSASAAEPSV
jgi:DNA-binding response OmpR family regulator